MPVLIPGGGVAETLLRDIPPDKCEILYSQNHYTESITTEKLFLPFFSISRGRGILLWFFLFNRKNNTLCVTINNFDAF